MYVLIQLSIYRVSHDYCLFSLYKQLMQGIWDLPYLSIYPSIYHIYPSIYHIYPSIYLLMQLELQHCPGVTNGGLLDLVSRCPSLQHLDLTGRSNTEYRVCRLDRTDACIDVLTYTCDSDILQQQQQKEVKRSGDLEHLV